MNKLIKAQLSKITSTEVSYDDDTTEIFIPKTIKIVAGALKQGECYEIELKDFILNPSENSTLASNWNRGVVPKYKTYVAEIQQNLSKMIKVLAVAKEDSLYQFDGWLPYDGFTVISKL